MMIALIGVLSAFTTILNGGTLADEKAIADTDFSPKAHQKTSEFPKGTRALER